MLFRGTPMNERHLHPGHPAACSPRRFASVAFAAVLSACTTEPEVPPEPFGWGSLHINGDRACVIKPGGVPRCWGRTRHDVPDSNALAGTPEGVFLEVLPGGYVFQYIREGGELFGFLPGGDYDEAGPETDLPDGRGWHGLTGYSGRTCALDADGQVHCWSFDWKSLATTILPYVVPPGSFLKVRLGIDIWGIRACAIEEAGPIQCWFADHGSRPESSDAGPSWIDGSFIDVGVAQQHGCGVHEGGELQCWGSSNVAALDIPAGQYMAVAVGNDMNCALDIEGEIHCWGVHTSMSGVTSPLDPATVTPPAGPAVAVSLNASGYWGCAILAAGGVECWGLNPTPSVDNPLDVPEDVRPQ